MFGRFVAPLALGLLAVSHAALAQTQTTSQTRTLPLWELGAAIGAGYAPDYPAADEYTSRIIPLPYFVYRGRVFRSEESGLLRGRLFHNDRIDFDISVAGAVDVKSADNDARQGMPDLDWMGQVGPRIQIRLAQAARDAHIDFELPVRAVLGTDFSKVRYVGLMSVPELAYQHDNFANTGLHLKLGFGVALADAKFQHEIYGVEPEFATATRPAYEAKGGYMGSRLQLSGYYVVSERLRVFGLLRGDSHQGAANEDSPLFRSKTGGSVITGFTFLFARSRSTVVE